MIDLGVDLLPQPRGGEGGRNRSTSQARQLGVAVPEDLPGTLVLCRQRSFPIRVQGDHQPGLGQAWQRVVREGRDQPEQDIGGGADLQRHLAGTQLGNQVRIAGRRTR